MTSPQTGRPSRAPHRVAVCDFSEGRVSCLCGFGAYIAPDPAYDRDEAVAAAFAEHRIASGQRAKPISHTIGRRSRYDAAAVSQGWAKVAAEPAEDAAAVAI